MNVLLVNHFVENIDRIIPGVLCELRKAEAKIRWRAVHDVKPQPKHLLWTLGRPTLVIAFRPVRHFRPRWATVLQPQPLTKVDELRTLDAAGVPVPRWTAFGPGEEPDLSSFGEYVVVKPSKGARGALVRIMKRTRVRWEPMEVRNQGPNEQVIVQDYIHTGSWPVSHRVGTVFGEPVYMFRVVADRSRPPLEDPRSQAFRSRHDAHFSTFSGFGGKSIVASSKGCVFDGEMPPEVIDLARCAHAAFPRIPLLGTDILKDAETGKLFISEVNAIGGTFNLTSDDVTIRKEFGLDLHQQFGGAAAVARSILRGVAWWASSGRQNGSREIRARQEGVSV